VGSSAAVIQVTVIDLATGGVNETLQIGNSSTTMFASASGRYAYILQYDEDQTSIYDSQYVLGKLFSATLNRCSQLVTCMVELAYFFRMITGQNRLSDCSQAEDTTGKPP
jgi:hypothetical protein